MTSKLSSFLLSSIEALAKIENEAQECELAALEATPRSEEWYAYRRVSLAASNAIEQLNRIGAEGR